jgi:DNA-binding GntR family transcriptional regulator
MSRAADVVYNEIRARILSGEIAPSTQLKEEDLAQMCGVSRTPIREALRRLEADMLILRTDTQRSFVPVWSQDEVEEIFLLRELLESHAAGRAAKLIDEEQLARLRQYDQAIHDAIAAEPIDYDAFVANNRLFHDLIIEAAQSPRLARLISLLVEQPILLRTARQYGREGMQRSHAGHEELIAAFTARDERWAESVMHSHIRQAMHVTVLDHSAEDDGIWTGEVDLSDISKALTPAE